MSCERRSSLTGALRRITLEVTKGRLKTTGVLAVASTVTVIDALVFARVTEEAHGAAEVAA
jgi:hypothetical protein